MPDRNDTTKATSGKRATKAKGTKAFERTHWDNANKMRRNLEVGEYKYVGLCLVLLKYVADAFAERRTWLEVATADAEKDDYYLPDADRRVTIAEDEMAFYDAIVQSDTAVMEKGEDTLRQIAHEVARAARESATIESNLKDTLRPRTRAKVRRLLGRHECPPNNEEQAIELVLKQPELLAADAA